MSEMKNTLQGVIADQTLQKKGLENLRIVFLNEEFNCELQNNYKQSNTNMPGVPKRGSERECVCVCE